MFGSGNQIVQLGNCELNQIGRLPFTFVVGSCTVTTDDSIYLCFGKDELRQCRSLPDPLGNVTEVDPSLYDHGYSSIAAGDGMFELYKTHLS